jgi:hypothetical protein
MILLMGDLRVGGRLCLLFELEEIIIFLHKGLPISNKRKINIHCI